MELAGTRSSALGLWKRRRGRESAYLDGAQALIEHFALAKYFVDGIVPVLHGEVLRAALPHSRLKILERCGHLPMAEKPETFHRLLYDFLLGVEEELPDVVQV